MADFEIESHEPQQTQTGRSRGELVGDFQGKLTMLTLYTMSLTADTKTLKNKSVAISSIVRPMCIFINL